MHKIKLLDHLKSFRVRLTIGIILLALVITLFLLKYSHKQSENSQNESSTDSTSVSENNIVKTDSIPKELDSRIDSVLFNFGIKKEWITTLYNDNTPQKTSKNKTVQKKPVTDASRFVKNVLIPRDLSTIEVNLDLTNYIKSTGLIPDVSEDILTKDITIILRNSADTIKNKLPAAKVIISHSDKVVRETGTFVIILNDIGDYKKEQVDNILNTTYEFSFIFPRNLDDIEVQNKLIQQKKDVIINLTIGAKENPEADFNTGLQDKEIKQRVRSFTTDFPSVNTVILTKTNPAAGQPGVIASIIQEFNNFKIRVIPDSLITTLLNKNEESSNDKVNLLINNIRSRGGQTNKNFISVITLTYKEFEDFYNGLSMLKKLGYKFYSLSDYLSKESERQKREKLKEEKLKDGKNQTKENKSENKDKSKEKPRSKEKAKDKPKEKPKQKDSPKSKVTNKSKDKTKPNGKK